VVKSIAYGMRAHPLQEAGDRCCIRRGGNHRVRGIVSHPIFKKGRMMIGENAKTITTVCVAWRTCYYSIGNRCDDEKSPGGANSFVCLRGRGIRRQWLEIVNSKLVITTVSYLYSAVVRFSSTCCFKIIYTVCYITLWGVGAPV